MVPTMWVAVTWHEWLEAESKLFEGEGKGEVEVVVEVVGDWSETTEDDDEDVEG